MLWKRKWMKYATSSYLWKNGILISPHFWEGFSRNSKISRFLFDLMHASKFVTSWRNRESNHQNLVHLRMENRRIWTLLVLIIWWFGDLLYFRNHPISSKRRRVIEAAGMCKILPKIRSLAARFQLTRRPWSCPARLIIWKTFGISRSFFFPQINLNFPLLFRNGNDLREFFSAFGTSYSRKHTRTNKTDDQHMKQQNS